MTLKYVSLISLALTATALNADVSVNVNIYNDGQPTATRTTSIKNMPGYSPVVEHDSIKLDAPSDMDQTTAKRSFGDTVTPAFNYPIKPSDLDHNHDTAMHTINLSGRYYVSQDLVPKFQVGKNNVAVLKITANNVTLNLNSKAIRVHPQSNTAVTGATGILVADSLFGTTVLNGNIHGTNGSSLVIATGVNLGSSSKDTMLKDLHVAQCTADGITMTSVNGLIMDQCSVTNCTAATTIAGFKATTCKDLKVTNSWFNNNTTSSGSSHGIHLIDCTQAVFENVNASHNQSTAAASAAAYGIRLANSSTGCANITFVNVKATNNATTVSGDTTGIRLESSTKNCIFNNVDVSGNTAVVNARGIYGSSSESCVFSDVKFMNSDGGTLAIGIDLSGCTDFSHSNVDASNNGGAAVYGVRLASSCKGCNFYKCGAANNVSTAGEAAGFSVSASPSNRYQECYANNMTAVGGQCSGFRFVSSSHGNLLENCEALSNAGNGAVYGFSFESVNGSKLVNCNSHEGSSTGSDVAGFNFTGSVGNALTNCEANHNVASSAGSNAYGFSFASTSKNNLLSNCNATVNTVQAANKVAAGFRCSAGSGNSFTNCNATGQTCEGTGTLSSGAIQQYACGFLFQSNENASKIVGCKADNNDGGLGEGVGFGIYLQGNNTLTSLTDTTAPNNTIVRDTVMSFNTSQGTTEPTQGNKYGLFDAQKDTTSVLINNVAIGHGRCIATLDTSYNFVDPVASSDANGMNFMFHHTGTDENPANMIHETDIFNWTTLSTSVPGWMNTSVVTGQVATVS